MINNIEIIKDKYGCNRIVANYLIYKKNLPLLGIDKWGRFYFTYDYKLYDILKHLPFLVKVASLF